MSVSRPYDYPGAALVVDGSGFEVEINPIPPHEILLTVEHDDTGWCGPHTAERTVAIAPEDWQAIVTYVAAERMRLAPAFEGTDR